MEIAKPTQDLKLLSKHRVYAFTFDMFMVGMTSKLIMLTYRSFFTSFFYQLKYHVQQSVVAGLPVVHLSVLMAVFFSYFFISYYTSEGKTLGKMIFGLRVYSPAKPEIHLSLAESAKRSLGYLVCYVTGLFLFALPLFRKDQKGVPDFFSNTEVVFEDFFEQHLVDVKADDDEDQFDLFDEAA
tara:strand:- start:146 stop:694 length:549 start_codon:yes stop_codon:yes gene_type:complete